MKRIFLPVSLAAALCGAVHLAALVLGWDGQKYVDQTRRYPERSRALAAEYRDRLLKALKQRGDEGWLERQPAAAGYYANALALGEGEAAWKWLLARAPGDMKSWLRSEAKELRKAVARSGGKAWSSQEKLLKSRSGC